MAKAAKRDKKAEQKQWDEKIAGLEEILAISREAVWLTSKFGSCGAEIHYEDVPGLCKIAYISKEAQGDDQDGVSIEEKGWSLTPGAYVGVAPVEDDGVDFHERMMEIHTELLKLQDESNQLMATISQNLKEMGL